MQVTPYEYNCAFSEFAKRYRTEDNLFAQLTIIKFLWKKTVLRGGFIFIIWLFFDTYIKLGIVFASKEQVPGIGLVGHLNVLFGAILHSNVRHKDKKDSSPLLIYRGTVFRFVVVQIC